MLYQERNEEQRLKFVQTLERKNPKDLVYVDECGFDTPLIRAFGYSFVGQRLIGEHTGKRFNRTCRRVRSVFFYRQ
jgi:hypothetical protein